MTKVLLLIAVMEFLPLLQVKWLVLQGLSSVHGSSVSLPQSYSGKGVDIIEALRSVSGKYDIEDFESPQG